MENLPRMNRWWILARGNRKNLGEKPKQLPKQRHQRTVSKPQQRSRRKRKTSPRNQPVPKPKPTRKKSPAWRVKKAKHEQSQVAMAEGKKKILWKRRCTVFLVFGYDVKWSNCQTTSFEHFSIWAHFFNDFNRNWGLLSNIYIFEEGRNEKRHMCQGGNKGKASVSC